MDPESYIAQFYVIGKDEVLNCDGLIHILYATILNKFKVDMTKEEYFYFKEYQERVFDLVENLRELDGDTISIVLEYLYKINAYLADIIIMLWCLPRTDQYLSRKRYHMVYYQNIQKYNTKITNLIEHNAIKCFCLETLSKTINVPVHCIDYLWYYMNTLSLEFSFFNANSGDYVSFVMPEHKHDENHEYIDFGFNMEYMLRMGLGKISYRNDPLNKGAMVHFLKYFITDIDIVTKLLTCKTRHNYQMQMKIILNDPSKYFEDIPIEVTPELQQLANQVL